MAGGGVYLGLVTGGQSRSTSVSGAECVRSARSRSRSTLRSTWSSTCSRKPGDDHTLLTYTGRLGTDPWRIGERWGDVVAPKWESVVASAFGATKKEAERRQAAQRKV